MDVFSFFFSEDMSAESQRSPEASQDGDTGRGSLLSQLRKFDKTQLHKTETTVTYADGISLVESKDDDGKTVVKHTSSGSYGFVPSVVADLQVGEILPGLIMGMITYCTARQCSPLRRKFM